ncbi:MAG TPA: SdrD B-like domain-containing protein, partial [Gemmataceae bacterium]|nr:SdrD B-like domain-containing protein [Gemmataceae bacterium]
DKLPTAWDLDTDLKKHFKHHSSGPIQSIDVDATIDDTQDGVTNPDHVVVHVRGLPTDLEVMMGQEADTTDDTAHTKTHTKTTFAHASGTVGSISFEETRDLPSAGHRPSWVFAQITGLPGNVDMVDKTVTDLTDKDNPKDTTTTDVTVTNPDNTPGTLPFVRIVTSVDSKATTLANDLALFTNIPSTPGGLVKRDGFEQTIDNRYYPGSVRDRLNDLYGTSPGLDSTGGQLEDHYLTRKYGERTIPGVTVTLSGDASQTTTTDANGNYSFAGLSPGKYTITETQPAGVTEGLVNGPGDLGGDASANTFANITVGTTQDGNGKTVTQSGHGYNFGERSLPNPGLAAGPGAADPNAPGTLSGSVFLDENNDGVYQAKDLVDYTDIQMSNFQSLHTLKAPGGVQKADLSVPGNPPHPFFFGSADRDSLTFAKIENLPSTVHLDVIKKEHVYLDTNTSAGRVDFYMGPIGGAGHGDEAIRATLTGAPTAGGVFVNTPTSVHLDYKDVGKFPGGASFQASGPFELRLLYQTTDKRVVGDLQMEDATLSYGIQGPTFASDVVHVSDIFNFLPGPIKDLLTLPLKLDDPSIATALGLFKVFAKLDTVGDVSGQGASGFFSLYDLYNNPEPLDGGGPAPGSSEFVPRLTASVRNFQGVDTSFELELEPKPWEQNIPGIPFELDFTPPTPHFGPGGGFTLDFWDTGLFDIKIPPIEALGVTIFPELDFKDPPDYATGNPWHIVPFLFSGGPIDPFPPQLADGVGPGAAPADVITAVPDAIVQEAVSRWQAAGQHPESLGPIKFAVADLPGSFLGTVTGNTVWIDRDAAGHGWFVDPTPRDDAEFPAAAGTAAAGRMDLLTVVSHEIGRLLGLDVPDAGQYPVMSLTLAPGTRLGDGAAAAGGVVAAADNLVVTDTTARPLPAAMTFGAGVTAGPGFTSPAAFAPELGGVALADADGEAETSQTPVVALFDPEKQWTAAALGGDLPLDTATRSGSGGMLAAYTQRPADPMTEDEFAPLWVG